MAYTAPDPEQFKGMESAYSFMAPSAAILITMPSFVFPISGVPISRIIFMNQCNPGKIMRIGAEWLRLAEMYSEAGRLLKENIDSLDEDDWEADDRTAFNDKSEKVISQLNGIAGYAMVVGISLFSIASLLAVMVPFMLAVATFLQAAALVYMVFRPIPFLSEPFRASVEGTAKGLHGALEALDKVLDGMGNSLAAVMGANTTISWVDMAVKGNIVNPATTLASTGFSLMQGLAQMGLRNLAAPGRGKDTFLGKHFPGVNDKLMGSGAFNAGTQAFTGGQGAYNMGNNIQGEVDPDAPNAMKDAGVDAGALDFVPNQLGDFDFEGEARGAGGGDTPPGAWEATPQEKEEKGWPLTEEEQAELDKAKQNEA